MARRPTVRFRAASRKRRADAPTEHLARIAWLLLTLRSNGVVEYASYIDRFGISRREFQRDLRKLREIGQEHGFTLSRTEGGRVFLYELGQRAPRLAANRDLTTTLARIAAALGGPVEHEMREAIGDANADMHSGFLHVREPLPSSSDRITGVFEFLKSAAAGPARVEFIYTSARGIRMTRRVEPYHIVERAGRYYLVAYDLTRRDWRYFALDAIKGPMRKEGTFTPRPVPERFLAERAVGWIRGPKSIDVTIRASPPVAAAIGSRIWQQGQRVTQVAGGETEITLAFDDLGEAVRWALSFGPDAIIVAPPEAVALARGTIERIGRAYEEGEPGVEHELLTG